MDIAHWLILELVPVFFLSRDLYSCSSYYTVSAKWQIIWWRIVLASLEIYSLWLYGHSKQHCRSSQVLSLVHSVVYILVELIIYYVSLNILFKRFLPEKVCIVLRELFHEETNSSCWWYIRWHSPVLWCWQQIYIIRILLFCLLSSRRQSILTCLIIVQTLYHKILPWRHHISYC